MAEKTIDPHTDIHVEIARLGTMTAKQLRQKYEQVFGCVSRSGNRRWLVRRLAWRLQADAEGGLSGRVRERAAELAVEGEMRVRPPAGYEPGCDPGASLDHIRPRRAETGLLASRHTDDRVPIPGTVLRRVFKGVEHRVLVLPHGFEVQTLPGRKVYRSLSAAAYAISGSHWNGYLFFGLTKPRGPANASGGRGRS